MSKTLFLTAIIILISSISFGQDAKEIMKKVDERDDGRTLISVIKLTSYKYGRKNNKYVPLEKPREKRMTFIKKDYGPKGKDHKSVSVIMEPKSEKGIGFLQYDYHEAGKDTDQWMYLSALGKVKRIVSGNDNEPKTGSFFGTEFNYEDLETYNLNDYTYKLLGQEHYRGKECFVIEATPVTRKAVKSNYSREIFWVEGEKDIILKSVLYNRNGKKSKKLYFSNIESINGILFPRKIVVNNLESSRATTMVYENILLNKAVDDSYLTQRTLTDKGFREKQIRKYNRSMIR